MALAPTDTSDSEPHAMTDDATLDSQLDAVERRCRRLATQRALFAAGVAVVPIPGIDWVTDIGVLLKALPEVNAAFGLTPAQIEALAPDRRVVVYKALSAAGSLVAGRVVTRELVLRVLKVVGVRLTTQQAVKYAPIAGQAVSAALTYTALKFVIHQHIRQCRDIAGQLRLPPPTA